MATFGDLHRDAIAGTIGTFDRLIFKGHLNEIVSPGSVQALPGPPRHSRRRTRGVFFEAVTARLKAHAKALADAAAGRSFT